MPVNISKFLKSQSGEKHLFRRFLEGLILVAVLWLIFIAVGGVLRRIAISQIAELTNTKIKVESVNFHINGSVVIKGLEIRPDRPRKYDDAILKAKTVYARFGIGSLFLFRPRLKKISVKDFVFNAQQDLDTGLSNLSALKIQPRTSGTGKVPTVRLKRGMLQYSKVINGKVRVAAAIPVDAEFASAEKRQDGYDFRLTTAGRAGFCNQHPFWESTLSGSWKPGSITVTGAVRSADLPAFEKTWMIDVLAFELKYDDNDNFSMKVGIRDFQFTHKPALRAPALEGKTILEMFGPFASFEGFYSQYQPHGKVDIDIKASGNFQRLGETKLAGKIYANDVTLTAGAFPYTVERIVGRIDFTEKGLSLNNLQGRHNDVKLAINGLVSDFGPNIQSEVRITSSNMALDDDLYQALDKNQKKLWKDFSPSGTVAVNFSLIQQPKKAKRYTLDVNLIDVEAVYSRFPYPLKNLSGRLLFDVDTIDISDMTSQFDGRKIVINGQVTDCNTAMPKYNLVIDVNNIPLDSTLAAALPDAQRGLYNQFDMTGVGDGKIEIFTSEQDDGPATFVADLYFDGITLKPKNLPVSITDISANAVFTPKMLDFKYLNGRLDQGSISLSGQIWPGPKNEPELLRYTILVSAQAARLSDDLLSVLPQETKNIVAGLRAAGRINYVAQLDKKLEADYPDFKVEVECLDNSSNFTWFPYPLKDIKGHIEATNNSVVLKDITAVAADSSSASEAPVIKINGRIDLVDRTLSTVQLQLLTSDISFSESLSRALPAGIGKIYQQLSPAGRFDLDFQKINLSFDENGLRDIDFDGAVKFKGCNLDIFPAVTDLEGMLQISALYKIGDGLENSRARFTADNVRIKGKALTAVGADIYYQPGRRSWATENLIADCYGGRLTGKFVLKHRQAALEYLLQVGFDDIDLEQFLSDTQLTRDERRGTRDERRETTTGRMRGALSIVGRVGNIHSRLGRCRFEITDMHAGKLSPMAKMLYVLKLTEPQDFAFDRMFVDSYIKSDTLLLDKVDLAGSALAFNGSGSMDLQSENIALTLTARGRRLATDEPSLLGSLVESLGQAVVRIDVTGNLNDPQIETTAWPVIKEGLEILGTPR